MKKKMTAVLLLTGILACTGCGEDDTASPSIEPESYEESVDESSAAEEKRNEDLAVTAVWRVWDIANDRLADGASWDRYYDAQETLYGCNDYDFTAEYFAYLDKAAAAMKEQRAETEAAEAVQKCWDFPNGKLRDEASWELLYDARDKLDACTDKNFTAQYEPAMTAIDAGLRQRDADDHAAWSARVAEESHAENGGTHGGGVLRRYGESSGGSAGGNAGGSDGNSSGDHDEDDFDPDDHDIEGYYEDHEDEYDDYEDAADAFEDDPDAWDDY